MRPESELTLTRTGVALVQEALPERPALEVAVSRAILTRVAAGDLPPTVRLHRCAPILAFSRQDRASAGYAAAVQAARKAGFAPVVRLVGGRAAVYHEATLACSVAVPDRHPAAHTQERFRELAELLAAALGRLGVDARVGEIPGEYCPGAWSVNAGGRTKLVGIGQRLIAGGAHRGAVIVAGRSERVREVLIPVYEALGLEWDPRTVGSIEDEVGDVPLERVVDAIRSELSVRYELTEAQIDDGTLALAGRLEHEHAVDGH